MAKKSIMDKPPLERRVGAIGNGLSVKIARQLQSILHVEEITTLELWESLSKDKQNLFTARALNMVAQTYLDQLKHIK